MKKKSLFLILFFFTCFELTATEYNLSQSLSAYTKDLSNFLNQSDIKNDIILLNKKKNNNIEQKWSKERSLYFKEIFNNRCSVKLMSYLIKEQDFSEILITNQDGYNICLTNETNDFTQSNKKWWQNSFNNGQGKSFWGELEFNQNTNNYGVPIYIPIYEQDSVIGICKAITKIFKLTIEEEND